MSERYLDIGRATRSEVLGERRVQELLDEADSFNRPLQELVTEYCWGRCWGRDGLTRKERSLLNLGMLAALNRADEFALHVKAAFGNGLTLAELREVTIQIAIYCGVPAGIEAQRHANKVIAELKTAGELADDNLPD
jgi:4-carboxymuconolactone decarboxylase